MLRIGIHQDHEIIQTGHIRGRYKPRTSACSSIRSTAVRYRLLRSGESTPPCATPGGVQHQPQHVRTSVLDPLCHSCAKRR